jgi:PilZ domain
MGNAKLNDKKSNRRVALRVYEQVNLFYQKILLSQLNGTQNGFVNPLDSTPESGVASGLPVEPSFPHSHSQENDTLNVNISSSGIAFTCTEELKAGDCLMLRILFLSNMTVLMTCCKVVYCKPSNPYESNRHPYSIGAQFVNITADDKELLNRHVSRRKKQQFTINAVLTALALALLFSPAEALGLVVEMLHHLLEITLHMLHLAFEVVESGLDHFIEHKFHTNTHDTQLIVFYTLVTPGLVALYFLGRMIPAASVRLGKDLLLWWSRKKSSCLYFWGQQTGLGKIKIVGIGAAAIVGYIYISI